MGGHEDGNSQGGLPGGGNGGWGAFQAETEGRNEGTLGLEGTDTPHYPFLLLPTCPAASRTSALLSLFSATGMIKTQVSG